MADEIDGTSVSQQATLCRRMSSSSESGFHSDLSDETGSQAAAPAVATPMSQLCPGTDAGRLEDVRTKAHSIVADVVPFMAKPSLQNSPPSSEHAGTMRRVATKLSVQHEILFKSIVTRLKQVDNGRVTHDSCRRTFNAVADEMFADKKYNWGRIVTIVAFAGWLAKRSSLGMTQIDEDEWINAVAAMAGDYIADKLAVWICQQGGWDTMDAFFAEEEPLESKMWRGLLFTFIGLGALATMAAVR